MEFLESEIARLVLGYLYEEKCEQAYNAFLKTSSHLVECRKMKKERRKYITKVLGLNLCDIIHEYAGVYTLVEERLKKVDPESFNKLTMQGTLLDKLTFLLNGTNAGQTVLFSITVPPGKSPQTSTVAHVRKKLRPCSTSERRKDSCLDSSKSSGLNDLDDNMSLNVETTALSSLPGNVKQKAVTFNDNLADSFDQISKTPRRKAQTLPPRRTHSSADDDEESNLDSLDFETISQAFVDHQLHQKIAKNINKIIYTPDLSNSSKTSVSKDLCSAQINLATDSTTNSANSLFSDQLDSAIKKVVQQTESDPHFEHFLQELLEPGTDEVGDASYDNKTASTPTLPSVDEPVKHSPLRNRLRNIRLKSVDASAKLCEEMDSEINHENSVAIQNIISINSEDGAQSTPAAKENCTLRRSMSASNINNITAAQMFNEFNPMEHSSSDGASAAPISESTINVPVSAAYPEPTVMSVPISASLNSNNEPVEINSVPIVSSTNLMVMGQPNLKPQLQPQIIMTEPFQPIMTDNRIYLINSNKGPGILMQPTFHLSQPTVISESDMIKMPVIMCDDSMPSTSYVLKNNPPAPRKIPKIMPKNLQPNPKDTIKISSSIQETESMNYIVNIQAEPKSLSEHKSAQTSNVEGMLMPANLLSTAINTSTTTSVTTIAGTGPTTSTVEASASGATVASSSVTTVASSAVTIVASSAVTTVTSSAVTTVTSSAVTTVVSSAVIPPARSVPLISLSSEKKNLLEEKCLTPLQSTSVPEVQSTSSTKSHIRALDFSTPPKKGDRARKSSSPTKSQKLAKTSLFVSPVKKPKIPIATKTPGPKLRGDWSGNDLIFQDNQDATKDLSSDSLNDSLDSKGRPRRAAVLKSPYGEKVTTPVKYKVILDDSAEKLLKNKDRWDEELRALLPDPPEPEKKSPAKKAARRPRSKSTNSALNTTADVATSIEAELAKMEDGETEPGVCETTPKEEENKKTGKAQSKTAKTKKIVEKKKTAPAKKTDKERKAPVKKTTNESKAEKLEQESEAEENNKTPEIGKRKPTKRKAKQKAQANIKKESMQEIKDIKEELLENKETIRNMNPRLRRKCNIGSVIKAPSRKIEPIVKEEETPIILPEALTESITTEQLRRDLEEEEDKLASETLSNLILTAPVIPIDRLENSTFCKITPDMSKKSSYISPMLAKRNITPALETPMKSDDILCPLTPNILSTYIDSPLNAVLNDKNLEFSAIMTPNFPMTPCIIPITPKIPSAGSIGSYASRPTDYSNCSSYYHPSDSEQGQKLEHALIQEAMKMEDFKSKTIKTSTPAKVITENIEAGNREINIIDSTTGEKNGTKVERKGTTACSVLEPSEDSNSLKINKSTTDSVLSDCNSSCSSDCSCNSSTVTGESDNTTDVSGRALENDATIIYNPTLKSPVKQQMTINEKAQQSPKKTKSPKRKTKSNVTSIHKGLLSELEEKRRRIMTGLQTSKKSPQRKHRILRNTKKNTKAAAKVARGRLSILDERMPNNADDNDLVQFVKKPQRGTKSCKTSIESVANKLLNTKKPEFKAQKVMSDSDTSLDSLKSVDEDEIPRLHITSDEEDKFSMHEKHSEDLVEGLKERGIHLIPNSTQNKNESTVESKTNKKINIKSDIILNHSKIINVDKYSKQAIEMTDVISTTKCVNIESELILNNNKSIDTLDNTQSEEFDLVTTTITEDSEEYIHVQHVPSSKNYHKTLADYDFTVLKDDIKAHLCLENGMQEICLTVTPCSELLCIPAKRKRKPTITYNAKATKEDEKKKSVKINTLNILYEDIGDSSSSSSDLFEISSKTTKKFDKAEDELMNLAITGTDISQDNTTKKRKMESDHSKQQNSAKKLKKIPRTLVRTLDVDSFLTRLHGPSDELS